MRMWNLVWKDDSFRTYIWSNTVGNPTSDGDFMYIPSGAVAYRPIYPAITQTGIFQIDIRARYVGSPAPLTIKLYDSTGTNVIYTATPNFDVNSNSVSTVNSPTYAWYTTGGPVQIPSAIGAISLQASGNYEIDVDYICFTSFDSIDLGGNKIDVQVNKKTPVLRIPNRYDVVQELGISSRSEVVVFPKVSRLSYNWVETKVLANTPVEFISPDFQATGFLVDAQAQTQAGWVGVGIDNQPVGQLYDVTSTFVKADMDVDAIYATVGKFTLPSTGVTITKTVSVTSSVNLSVSSTPPVTPITKVALISSSVSLSVSSLR